MSEAALIEELARALAVARGDDPDGLIWDTPSSLWVWYTDEAQAILPIIRAREIAAGERVREAAAKESDAVCPTCHQRGDDTHDHCPDPFHWQTTPQAIRALDIPSILKDEA